MAELIAQGHLVPPISMATRKTHFADEMDGRKRDEVTREIVPILTAAVSTKHRRRCLVFCTNIEHAKLTQELLQKDGQHSVYLVHSDLGQKEQEEQFLAFENSKVPAWLVNVGIVTLGVDIPSIDCIAILRGITSFALLVQIIGRGLRPWAEKIDCLIYDFGHGTSRFGFIDDPDFGVVSNGTQLPPPLKPCPGCDRLLHWSAMACSSCGHVFPRKTSLHGNALQVQLLSRDYLRATYKAYLQNQDPNMVEHQFTFNGQTLRALEFLQDIRTSGGNKFDVGDSVMVKRLDNEFVKIIRF